MMPSLSLSMMPKASLNSWICFWENREKMFEPDFFAFFDPLLGILCCCLNSCYTNRPKEGSVAPVICFWENREKMFEPDFFAFFDPLLGILCCCLNSCYTN